MAIRSLKNGTFSRSLLIGNEFYAPGNFNLIQTYTLSSTQSSVTFSSIPSTYTHLQIRAISQTNRSTADNADDIYLRFNSDSSDNYPFHRLRGNGASVDAAGNATGTGFTSILLPTCTGITSQTNKFGAVIIDILDYTNTNKNKTVRALCGVENNASPSWVALASGFRINTSAISSISLSPGLGTLFSQYSRFSLYGISE